MSQSRAHFLHCRSCDEIFRPSPNDRAPQYILTPDGYTQIMRDDCVEFLARHAQHALETLRPTDEGAWPDGMSAGALWPVSNGSERYVVEAWREHVTAPLRYRLLRGRLVTEGPTVEIREDEVREEVDRALYPGVVPERKLAAFVAAFAATVRALHPSELEPLYDLPGASATTVARLPKSARTTLATLIASSFDALERTCLELRLEAEYTFTVLVRQRVHLEPDVSRTSPV